MRCSRVLFPAALSVLFCLQASGQSVISVRSGLVNFFEGSVFIDDQPLQDKFGTFPYIKQGSTLRTAEGRAEILLTPGVLLRIDQNSAIRMITVALSDTRVEFLKGSAILDSTDAQPGNSPVVVYWGSEVRFPKPGVYRFDSDPAALLEVYSGEADVKHDGKSSAIDTSNEFFFLAGIETNKYGDGNFDPFYDWAKNRSDLIAADNRSAAQSAVDPGDIANGQNLPIGPGLDPSIPIYGSGSIYGGPIYGGSTIGSPFGNGSLYPYSAFGPYGPYGLNPYAYGMFLIVPAYRYPRVHSRWPDRPRSSHWTPSSYAGIPPARARIPSYQPYRPPMYTPGAVSHRYVPATPAYSRPASVGMPRGSVRVGGIAAHPVGHR